MKSLVRIAVAARSSPLSRAQVQEVFDELSAVEEVEFDPMWIDTRGDRDLTTSLKEMGKTDFFTREIDEMILANGCRIAIHSAKDLPDPLPIGLQVVALTRGVDASDALVLRENATLEMLPQRARIGVSSARREQHLKSLRADLQCVDIRGPIGMRLSFLDQGIVDGVIVAEAALIRLKLTHRNRIRLVCETAPLQGQLAVIARDDDEEMKHLFAPIDVRKK